MTTTTELRRITLDQLWDSADRAMLMLCDTASWSEPPTSEQVFASEVLEINGYSRKDVLPQEPATYNADRQRAEKLFQDTTIAAVDNPIVYTGYAIARNGATQANADCSADNTVNQINAIAHGLTDGDAVMITTSAQGELPAGLDGLTRYYARGVDADSFELFTDSQLTTPVTFTSNGSELTLRHANGVVGPYKLMSTERTIDPAGGGHEFTNLVFFSE